MKNCNIWVFALEAVAFKNSQGITITHRIVEKLDQDGAIVFKTKGDANNSSDSELIPKSSVIGKQVFTVPYLGRLTAFLRTPVGFIALIIVPAIIFILGELVTIKKEMEKQIKKKVLDEMNPNP
ncbi:signal peptidase I [Candidatus Gottesmanbacteria bacterium]|nr:signal peptidase I [Candidatus Gottesmanbacteria bacterium]